jgi:Flp pilus assembly protein TadD
VSEAEIPARRAVALAPRQGQAHATLGAILVAEQRLAPGVDELTFATHHGVDDPMTYIALAFAQEMTRQDTAAAHTYMELRNRWPADPYVLTALTQYLTRKSSPDALFYAQRVVGIYPNWAVAHVLLAKAYAGRSDAHHAREHMRRATELFPGFMGYWADLGDYALIDGDTAAAWTAFSHARALDSVHFDAMSVYRDMWATVKAAHH